MTAHHYCWFDHEPILYEILLFLPPAFLFFDPRIVCKTWKKFIESEKFAKLYYREVLGNGTEGEIYYRIIDDDDQQPVQSTAPKQLVDFSEIDRMLHKLDYLCGSSAAKKNDIESILEKFASPEIKSMSWKEHFHFKFLFCFGLNIRKRDCQNPLSFLEESLTISQLQFMKMKFKGWGLGNMLKRDLIAPLNHKFTFIMFRDDGTPFKFDNDGFNGQQILNYRECTLFDDTDYQPGIQIHGLSQILLNSNSVQLNEKEKAMWEDYLSCVHSSYRHKRVNKIQPFQRVAQTSFMSDYQHVELSQQASQDYHQNVYLKWRPNVTWHE